MKVPNFIIMRNPCFPTLNRRDHPIPFSFATLVYIPWPWLCHLQLGRVLPSEFSAKGGSARHVYRRKTFGNLIMPSVGHAAQRKKIFTVGHQRLKKHTDGQHY